MMFASPEEKSQWLQTVQSRNTAPISVEVSPTDSILALSTCLDATDSRVAIHARLIKRQPR